MVSWVAFRALGPPKSAQSLPRTPCATLHRPTVYFQTLMAVPNGPQKTHKEVPKGAPETAKTLSKQCHVAKGRFHENVVLLQGNQCFWASEGRVEGRKTTRKARRECRDAIRETTRRSKREKGSPKWPDGDRREVDGRALPTGHGPQRAPRVKDYRNNIRRDGF